MLEVKGILCSSSTSVKSAVQEIDSADSILRVYAIISHLGTTSASFLTFPPTLLRLFVTSPLDDAAPSLTAPASTSVRYTDDFL